MNILQLFVAYVVDQTGSQYKDIRGYLRDSEHTIFR